jgi:glycosyltransferase involved in cell wall biosynthesis
MSNATSSICLSLFFTAGVGLTNWKDSGNLERELALYRCLADKLGGVDLITYGGPADRDLAPGLPEFGILPVTWRSRQQFTAAEIALRYSMQLIHSNIFKTNQMRGALIPVWLKKLYNKKLIVRCGFLHAWFTRRQTDDPRRIHEAVELERRAFNAADRVVVTSQWQKESVCSDYGLTPEKVCVIPNYVDTNVFQPFTGGDKRYDLVFVGRGDRQKNLEGLLEALARLKNEGREVSTLMVGGCSGNQDLREMASRLRLKVDWLPNQPGVELPRIIASARVFVMPSFYEGHPKALLEAMSCGAACLGTDVPGIREDLRHMDNSFLCGTEPESMAEAIRSLLDESFLREELGRKARQYIAEKYSLDRVSALELELLTDLAGNRV